LVKKTVLTFPQENPVRITFKSKEGNFILNTSEIVGYNDSKVEIVLRGPIGGTTISKGMIPPPSLTLFAYCEEATNSEESRELILNFFPKRKERL